MEKEIFRNTKPDWLFYLLENGKIKSHTFFSFSFNRDSGGQDKFGNVLISFDYDKLFGQGAEEIWYEIQFMNEFPEICKYVTAFSDAQEYYDSMGVENGKEAHENYELSWPEYIESFEHEEEIVIKELSYEPGLINYVIFFHDKPSKSLLSLLKQYNINYQYVEYPN